MRQNVYKKCCMEFYTIALIFKSKKEFTSCASPYSLLINEAKDGIAIAR